VSREFSSGPVLWTAVLLSLLACASAPRPQALTPVIDAYKRLDEFGAVLVLAGLPAEQVPQDARLTPKQAANLHEQLALTPFTIRQYGPRLVALRTLRVVEAKCEAVSRVRLGGDVQRFETVYTLRPDGFLAPVLSATPHEHGEWIGPVEVVDGQRRAGEFFVDYYYRRNGKGGWLQVVHPGETATVGGQCMAEATR
jgi:hypothetical protein